MTVTPVAKHPMAWRKSVAVTLIGANDHYFIAGKRPAGRPANPRYHNQLV